MIYFGTDGIRGIVGEDLTQEICFRCGNAVSKLKPKAKIIGTRPNQSVMVYMCILTPVISKKHELMVANPTLEPLGPIALTSIIVISLVHSINAVRKISERYKNFLLAFFIVFAFLFVYLAFA